MQEPSQPNRNISIPRLVIGGTGSGVGKTTTVLALAMAFQKRGLRVSVFKCGPDYLDPTYHRRVTGRICPNLDSWMMGRDAVISTFLQGAKDTDLALIEGVMGLYDGLSPDSNIGSTAEIAQWLNAPVLMTLDASGMARTFAAIAHGMRVFDPSIRVAGAIANFVGSEGHLSLLRTSLSRTSLSSSFKNQTSLPLVGGFPKTPEHAFPERHLGLHSAQENSFPEESLKAWGELCESWFDLDQILQIARSSPELTYETKLVNPPERLKHSRPPRIAIARDAAFHFYYEENLRLLQESGAELIFFSPLQDRELPQAEGLYLGGGYPELHAEQLANNSSMRDSIRSFYSNKKPIYAECGGLMYLTDGISTLEKKLFPMVGLIPGIAQMHSRMQALGYVEVTTLEDTLLGPAGTRFRGHQFRYSELEIRPGQPIELRYRLRKRRGNQVLEEGYSKENLIASYVHGHWASNPRIASYFTEACRRSQSEHEPI